MTPTDSIGPLFTDLYELTMGASYFEHGMNQDATFSLFIRSYPERRGFFVAAGLEDVLNELENWHLTETDIDFLERQHRFSKPFISYLRSLRFSGSVRAVPEGTICFADEPLLEITAPIVEAQLLETYLLNAIGFATLIATKAARCIHAGAGRPLIDFSLRRTQGIDAGMKVARSTYLTGFAATSNVLAGKVYGIPISGTMAHSYVTAFDSEMAGLRGLCRHLSRQRDLFDRHLRHHQRRPPCRHGGPADESGRQSPARRSTRQRRHGHLEP